MLLGQQALQGWPAPLDLPARQDPQGPPGRRGQRVQLGFKARLGQPAPRGRLAPQVLQVPQAPKGKQETQALQARLVPKDYKDPPVRFIKESQLSVKMRFLVKPPRYGY